MKKRTEKEFKNSLKSLVFIAFFLFFITILIFGLYNSLFFKKPERINIFIFNEKPVLLSLSTIGESSYYINLYPDLKLNIPGGYGDYRIGALVKLSNIEKDNTIINRAIAGSLFTFLDYYFYTNDTQSIFGESKNPEFSLNIKNLILNKSNASILDKIYLILKLVGIQNHNFVKLEAFEMLNKNKDMVLDTERFIQEYNGLFFQHAYRDERKSVQILYTNNYKSADTIAKILENNGIRVVDISETNKTYKECKIIEKNKKYSITSKKISKYLSCDLINADTGISDVVIYLGNIEELWK